MTEKHIRTYSFDQVEREAVGAWGDPEIVPKYAELLADRRMCSRCAGEGELVQLRGCFSDAVVQELRLGGARPLMVNPWVVTNESCEREYGRAMLGLWEQWQGNLASEIVIVGQDFSSLDFYVRQRGLDIDEQTNLNLRNALRHVGIIIPPVESRAPRTSHKLLFINSVLCLKLGQMDSPVDPRAYRNCLPFLKRTIELAPRKLVVTMGGEATASFLALFESARGGHRPGIKITEYIKDYPLPRKVGPYVHWACTHLRFRGWAEHWENLRVWIRACDQADWASKFLD